MTPMRDRANVGSHWRRRRDKTLWWIKQSHRSDRIACLVPVGSRHLTSRIYVSFGDLRTKFEEVEP
jgi:hypothetical protein